MSDIITKRSEEFKELTDWMVQTTREIETAMKHLRPTIGQEHYLTGDEICRRFHVCKRTLQTLRDTKARKWNCSPSPTSWAATLNWLSSGLRKANAIPNHQQLKN